MKKTVDKMTMDEVLIEQVMTAFGRILSKAKNYYTKAQAAETMVYHSLVDMCIDADEVLTEAENATNLTEAIACYLCYDEYSHEGIMKEVRKAYTMKGDNNA